MSPAHSLADLSVYMKCGVTGGPSTHLPSKMATDINGWAGRAGMAGLGLSRQGWASSKSGAESFIWVLHVSDGGPSMWPSSTVSLGTVARSWIASRVPGA